MKPLPTRMADEIVAHLAAAVKNAESAMQIIQNPGGHRDETLEKNLNLAKDRTFEARSVFLPEALRELAELGEPRGHKP
jgi:hypothetical protein